MRVTDQVKTLAWIAAALLVLLVAAECARAGEWQLGDETDVTMICYDSPPAAFAASQTTLAGRVAVVNLLAVRGECLMIRPTLPVVLRERLAEYPETDELYATDVWRAHVQRLNADVHIWVKADDGPGDRGTGL